MGNTNANLHRAKKAKNDEFYTQMSDIKEELQHYTRHFIGKTVYCNCDDPTWSNFWRYFHENFSSLGLKKLISTHYEKNGSPSYALIYEGGNDADIEVGNHIPLQGNGDFRSDESIKYLNEADIVCTNPPFSLARDYVLLLINSGKDYLILGHQNWITYKELFPYIKDNKMLCGVHNSSHKFVINRKTNETTAFGNIFWYTNIDINKHHVQLVLTKEYDPEFYPKYDNYNAINVDKVADVPANYTGVMGVPISFLTKYCPEQFEIIGMSANGAVPNDMKLPWNKPHNNPFINGKAIYQRIMIRRKSCDVL